MDDSSFESGGSTHAATPGGDGASVGTRDGQAWETWRVTPAGIDAGATAALSTLQTCLFGPEPGTASDPGSGIDFVA